MRDFSKNHLFRPSLKAGRGTVGKIPVIGMLERGGSVKAIMLAGTSAKTIQSAVKNVIVPSSTLCTDEHASYKGMAEYKHMVINHSAKQWLTPTASRAFGLS